MRDIYKTLFHAFVYAILVIASAQSNTLETSKMMKLYEETGKRITEWEQNRAAECLASSEKEEQHKASNQLEIIPNLPDRDMAGVENNLLRLCATVAGGVYEATSRADFEKLLQAPWIHNAYPDLTVRFFQNGVTFGRDWLPEQLSLNAPSFLAVITGSTLILGWRGTVTIKDILADANIDSIAPWKSQLKGLEVQKAYYEMIRDAYFKKHAKDIENYVKGNYSKQPNKIKMDGTPITQIILTGHSLGGGLAQVAHLFLRVPPSDMFSPFKNLVKACEDVEIKTIAISAPMTTVLNKPSSETIQFLHDKIQPHMRNIVLSTDLVPRGYAHLEFINGFVNAFLNDKSIISSGIAGQLAASFVRLHVRIFKQRGMIEQAGKYLHVGKLIYYDTVKATPEIYVDGYMSTVSKNGDNRFRDLKYGPKSNVADMALQNHMVLVTGPGLVPP